MSTRQLRIAFLLALAIGFMIVFACIQHDRPQRAKEIERWAIIGATVAAIFSSVANIV